MTPPDLSALTSAQASTLEQIVGAATTHFINLASNARLRLANGGTGRWVAAQRLELAEALRLETAARSIEKAAHLRALKAGREECAAVRVIAAFAECSIGERPRRIAA
jgi:hypothetical protein